MMMLRISILIHPNAESPLSEMIFTSLEGPFLKFKVRNRST